MSNALRTLLSLATLALTLTAFAGTAAADDKGEKILAKVDSALNAYRTLTVQYRMTTREKGRDDTFLKIRTSFKGKKQFTKILGPPDMKGMRVLHLSNTKVYIYMPSYRKIRRVASHMTEGGFLGTTYSQRDMNLHRYRDFYTAEFVKDDGATSTVKLKAKAGSKAPYATIVMQVGKDHKLPVRTKMYDDKGNHVKTETRLKYFCEGAVCLAKKQKMVDHTKNDKYSSLRMEEHEINPSLPAKLFSKRNLQP